MKRTNVFISYSHVDDAWCAEVQSHLRYLERKHAFDVWSDKKIKPGSKWREEIRNAMATCKVAILIVTKDFMASDFVHNEEVPDLLRAAASEGCRIFPLIVGHSVFKLSELAEFQTVNGVSKPLESLDGVARSKELVKLAEAVAIAMNDDSQLPVVVKPSSMDPLKMTLREVLIFCYVCKNSESDLSVTDIHKGSDIKNRKHVMEALYLLEEMGAIEKTKPSKQTVWRVSANGLEIFKEFSGSLELIFSSTN